jgi:hypothetical protein
MSFVGYRLTEIAGVGPAVGAANSVFADTVTTKETRDGIFFGSNQLNSRHS